LCRGRLELGAVLKSCDSFGYLLLTEVTAGTWADSKDSKRLFLRR
jgi:hypothetical protein